MNINTLLHLLLLLSPLYKQRCRICRTELFILFCRRGHLTTLSCSQRWSKIALWIWLSTVILIIICVILINLDTRNMEEGILRKLPLNFIKNE